MKIAVHLVLWLSLFLEMFSLIEFCGWSSFSFTASSSTLYKIIHLWHCSYSADCPSLVCVMLREEEWKRDFARWTKMHHLPFSSLLSIQLLFLCLHPSLSLFTFYSAPHFTLISSVLFSSDLDALFLMSLSVNFFVVCLLWPNKRFFLLSFFSSFSFSLDHEWQKGTWKNSLRLPKFLLSVKGVASIPYFLYTLILTFCCLMSLYHHLCSLYF